MVLEGRAALGTWTGWPLTLPFYRERADPRQCSVDDDVMLESHHGWATETVKLMAEAKMIRRKEFNCVLCSMKE